MSENKTETATAAAQKKAGTVVYCGPTVRGVAQQFTPFIGGVPQRVQDFLDKYHAAALLVPLARFAQVRLDIKAGKGVESALIRNIEKQLKEG